jgi:hypothetical protein
MNKEEAIQQLKNFYEGISMLTFSIKEYPGDEWVAQCNEIDSIITGGVGGDIVAMENLMQDAILTAAGIPKEFADGLLKRVWGGDITSTVEIDTNSSVRLFQSSYEINSPMYARAR